MLNDEQLKASIDFYMGQLSPVEQVASFSVVRAHLLFERLLRDALASRVRNPAALADARLSFAQVLALAVAMVDTIDPGSWIWESIRRLNKLRNLLAHQLSAPQLDVQIAELTTMVVRNIGIPLPQPVLLKDPVNTTSLPGLRAIDVALIGLYAILHDRLHT